MKVLRLIEAFYPFVSGPAKQAFNISKRLEENKISSPIFTTNYHAEDAPLTEDFEGISVRRFRIRYRFMRFFYTPHMKKEVLHENPDIIHARSH